MYKYKKKFDWFYCSLCIGMFAIIGALGYGWIANVVKLFHSSFDPITGHVVLRAVGVIVAPLGIIMGYL